jgi:hypothetical protein
VEKVTGHIVEGANNNLEVVVIDERGPDGANQHYRISGFDTTNNTANLDPERFPIRYTSLPLVFQNRAPDENGMCGLTLESLLAVAKHRLEGFQSGPYPCYENAEALKGINSALTALTGRTRTRMALAGMKNKTIS